MTSIPRLIYFITHPNVVISANEPVPSWPLSELGRARMRSALAQPWIATISSINSQIDRRAA